MCLRVLSDPLLRACVLGMSLDFTQKSFADKTQGSTKTIFTKFSDSLLVEKALKVTPTCLDYKTQLLKAATARHGMPEAQGGNTRVYLPKDALKIVLKASGADSAKRFLQMQEVRSILQAQKSSHLIIPEAAVCGDFLVEDRLPINVDNMHNMGTYVEEPALFDEAVREMTRLFSEVYLSDLVSSQRHPLTNLVGDQVRYDNIPLYIEEENGVRRGMIGLIDLEHMQKKSISYGVSTLIRSYLFVEENIKLRSSIDREFLDPYFLSTLVRIFPYHKNLIIEEATKLGLPIDKENLEEVAVKGEKCLLKGYIEHRDQLRKKGITRELATKPFEISSDREKVILALVEKEILRLGSGQYDQTIQEKRRYINPVRIRFLDENPEKEAEKLIAIFINNIKAEIKREQSDYLRMSRDQVKPETELVALRSSVIFIEKLYPNVSRLLRLHDNSWDYSRDVTKHLLSSILEELVKGQEIFFFDRKNDVIWIQF